MRSIFYLILTLIPVNVLCQDQPLNLIPQPVEVQQLNGKFILSKSTTISYNKPEGRNVAEMLVKKLNTSTGYSLKPQLSFRGSVQLNLNGIHDQQLGREGYTLLSTPRSVIITANETAGLFYGMQTLLQLFPAEIESKSAVTASWSIPTVKIKDYPRFGWRGIMLDVSRHFFSKEDVKSFIDQIARYKFNTFHWHLTDDHGWRVEIKSLPRLTEVGAWRVPRYGRFGERTLPKPGESATYGGFYTQDDIREIIRFAAERHVTIVPEIDVPGHSMAIIAAYPELSCRKDTSTKVNPGTHFAEWYGNGTFKMNIENTLNPSDEKVYEVLDKIFTELAELFPNPYIHVGGDECYKGYWKQDTGCQALMKKLKIRHVEDLQGYFMNRVEDILKSKGKKLIGWDEILEGGISPEATVMSWRGVRGGTEAAGMGHDVVMSPTTFAYLDYQQGESTIEPYVHASLRLKKCYSFEPVPDGVDAKYILGGQGNVWTEHIPTFRHAQYMTWPRGWALAEVYWSPEGSKDWNSFIDRAEKHFERSDLAAVNCSRSVYDAIIRTGRKNDKLMIEMDTEAPRMEIYYTTDGIMPDNYSLKYCGPFELPEGPVSLRVITYRDGRPIGHLIILDQQDLRNRIGR